MQFFFMVMIDDAKGNPKLIWESINRLIGRPKRGNANLSLTWSTCQSYRQLSHRNGRWQKITPIYELGDKIDLLIIDESVFYL